jgi:sulfotransferase 6B1
MTSRMFALLGFLLASIFLYKVPVHAEHRQRPFVVVTPPKAGTHLLTKAVEKLTGKKCRSIFSTYVLSHEDWKDQLAQAEEDNCFIQIHALPKAQQIQSLKRLHCRVIFLIRDPRDQAVSLLHFIEERNWSLGPLSLDMEPYMSLSLEDKLHEIITGDLTGFSGVSKIFSRYLPWSYQGKDFVLTLRYEDLVGSKGGGSDIKQQEAMKKLAQFVKLNLTDQQIAAYARTIYGKPGEKTFRKGQIGDWQNYFKFKHNYEMNRLFGEKMKEVGYTYGKPPEKQPQPKPDKKLKNKKFIVVQEPGKGARF